MAMKCHSINSQIDLYFRKEKNIPKNYMLAIYLEFKKFTIPPSVIFTQYPKLYEVILLYKKYNKFFTYYNRLALIMSYLRAMCERY